MVGPRGAADKRSLILAACSLALYVFVARAVTGSEQTLLWLFGYVLLWGLYALWLRLDVASTPKWPALLLFALACRLSWVLTPVWLSDDLYRYLLDGRVWAEGINPFRYAPAHALIRSLEPELAGLVNHPEVPTIYPATVQITGWVAALLGFGVNAWRALIACLDVLALPAIAAAFGGGHAGRRAAAVYGLCPLAVVEAGANGHVEALVTLSLFSGIALLRRRHSWEAGMAFAAAVLTKLFPVILAPLLVGHSGWKRALTVAGGAVIVGTVPFALGHVDPTIGLRTYLDHWSFNGPVYSLLVGIGIGDRFARAFPLLVVLAGAGWARRRAVPSMDAARWLVFAFLLCSPTLHPWYALWLLPWLGPRPHVGLLSFVFAMGLSYVVWWQELRTGEWTLTLGQALTLWGIVLAGFLGALLRARPERDSSAAAC